MKIRFTKRRFYQGTLREIGQVVDMPDRDAKAYIESNAGVLIPKDKKQTIFSRIEEQRKANLLKAKVAEPVKPVEEPIAVAIEPIVLEDKSYKELQEMAKKAGLPTVGSKKDIIYRLRK